MAMRAPAMRNPVSRLDPVPVAGCASLAAGAAGLGAEGAAKEGTSGEVERVGAGAPLGVVVGDAAACPVTVNRVSPEMGWPSALTTRKAMR